MPNKTIDAKNIESQPPIQGSCKNCALANTRNWHVSQLTYKIMKRHK